MNAQTLTQKTIKEYNELRKEFSEGELYRFFGGLEGLRKIIKDGYLLDLYEFLNLPIEDWQRDC